MAAKHARHDMREDKSETTAQYLYCGSGQTTRLSPLRYRVRSPVWWTRTQSSCEKSKVNALPKVVGFLRVLRFPPTGKVDRVG